MLTIEVEFLTGRFYGSLYRDRHQAEWPPHPARLFSALVAAMHESGTAGEEERNALEWLEAQAAPEILASGCQPRTVVTAFVPINDQPQVPSRRTRQPRAFPSAVPEVPYLYYVWPNATPPAQTRSALAQVAAKVTRLGSAHSLVRAAVLPRGPLSEGQLARYVPSETGQFSLRTVAAGRLAELEQAFALGRRPSPGVLQPYRVAGAERPAEGRSIFAGGEFVSFRRVGGPAIPVEASLTLAAAVRAALSELGGPETPDLVHGRGRQPHCACLPLPFVDHPHANGRILGFAILVPREVSPLERRAVFRLLARLRQVPLAGVGTVAVEHVDAGVSVPYNLTEAAWAGPAQTWASATPVVLDRFPRRGAHSLDEAEIITRSCAYLGLPAPAAVSVSPYSAVAGVPPARQFRTRRRSEDPPRPAVHVTVTFAQPVHGPLVLGAGRYLGLGLMRPLQARGEGGAP